MKCEYCGAVFESIYETKKYCSEKCKQAAKRKRKNIRLGKDEPKPRVRRKIPIKKWEPQKLQCDWCSKEFTQKTSKQHFCSKQCRINFENNKKCEKLRTRVFTYRCKNCGKRFETWHSNRVFCSGNCSDRYTSHKMNEAEWIKHLGENGYSDEGKKAVINVQSYFDSHSVPIDYVSGWIDTNHSAIVKCRECGFKYESPMGNIRKGTYKKCPECAKKLKEKKEHDKEIQKQALVAQKAKESKERETQKAIERESHKRYVKCDICGKTFITYRSNAKRCSKECTKKWANSRADKRLNSENIVDHDINLESLFFRDFGICYLCGKSCDWNDIKEIDGVKIAGENYPSIDHVIAIANGGMHSWDNVKLAHRRCNTKKRNRYLTKKVGNFAQFSIF